ncbi:hypothetical protein L198_00439 [Cryptococcus wingfieldii CBS 7118]|uniref:Zn(2)-C6 fungal-type domain-containing protein n=1 Tax=Cryptococcus wingfieldii CBS 7118 TaxID=1295528 RepID=A0A1E3K709_9TREE|nr:hypothetical protein L198_00439 [Cryptococcus wingfieldii CBS 7118]ODO08706.1 hypothetical protein L198_00439 [Cryptococcus wingfieldii CBS 7118]
MVAASHRTPSLRTKPPPNPHKGRKIVRGEQLKRNSACLSCRKRRIKCDAAKPHCASCVRSQQYLARTQPNEHHAIQCHYDNESDGSADDGHSERLSTGTGAETAEEEAPGNPPVIVEPQRQNSEPVADTGRQFTDFTNREAVDLRGAQISTSRAYLHQFFDGPSPMVDLDSRYQSPLSHQPLQYQKPFQPPHQSPLDNLVWRYNGLQTLGAPLIPSAVPDPYQQTQNPLPPSTSMSLAPETTLPSMTTIPGDDDLVDALTPLERRPSRAATVADEINEEAGDMDQLLMWSGWPSSLPSPTLVNHLVEIFFTKVPTVSRIIHRDSFMTRLSHAPTHPDFPHLALIHALCAIASRHSAAVHTRTVQENLQQTAQDAKKDNPGRGEPADPANEDCFSEQQAIYASRVAMSSLHHVSGRGLFDVLQATILVCHWGQSDSRWMDCWASVGLSTRLAICLGLLNDDLPGMSLSSLHQSILPPAKTDAEREERRAVLWYVMYYDTAGSACSGWPGTLPNDEITARLPAGRVDCDRGDSIPENPQSYISPDIYHNHPVPDSFVMLLKGNMLLYRASKLIRKCRSMRTEERAMARDMEEFKAIERDLATLSLTWPSSLRDPIQYTQGNIKTIDSDLISAHLVPHIVAIHLHEPFANVKDSSCTSAARLLSEARACLNIVFLIVRSKADITYMVPPITSCDYLYSAIKTLILFYHHALESADEQAASTFHSEITIFKNVFDRLSLRHSMVLHYLAVINTILASIERETLGHPVVDGDFSDLRSPTSRSSPFTSTASIPRSSNSYHTAGYSASFEMPTTMQVLHPDMVMAQGLQDALRAEGESPDSGSGERRGMGRSGLVHGILDQTRGFVNTKAPDGDLPDIEIGVGRGGGMGDDDVGDPSSWLDWQNVVTLDP